MSIGIKKIFAFPSISQRGAEVVAPYVGLVRIRRSTSVKSRAFCRVVEDADPYDRGTAPP